MSTELPVSATERARRHAVVMKFINTAISGDTKAFFYNAIDISWPGAWLDIFRALDLITRNSISDDIRCMFLGAWRGTRDVDLSGPWRDERPVGADWDFSKDLEGHAGLLVDGLRKLMPEIKIARPPLVLYRGQSLSEHEAGSYGVWWTTAPLYAETFARAHFRAHAGQGAVVVAITPADALIHRLNRMEFLLDPSRLTEVRLLDVPPRETAEEAAKPAVEREARSRVLGIPYAEDEESVREWLAVGAPLEGLKLCRDVRTELIAEQLAAHRMSVAA